MFARYEGNNIEKTDEITEIARVIVAISDFHILAYILYIHSFHILHLDKLTRV